MADRRGRPARARVLPRSAPTAPPFTRADLEGTTTRPGLLPVRVLAGLHRPAERLQRAAGRLRRAGRDALRRLLRRRLLAARRSRSSSAWTIEQLSDFEPKGATCRAFGVLHPGGFPQRALVLDRPRRRRALELPGRLARRPARRQPHLRRARRRRLSDLASAPLPPGRPRRPRPGAGGRARWSIVYGDYECPFCAALEVRLRDAGAARLLPPLPGPLEPPARVRRRLRGRGGRRCRARSGRCTTRCSPTRAASRIRTCGRAPSALGLDLERFDADRRSDAGGRAASRADFRGGVRAGVATHADAVRRRRALRRAGPAAALLGARWTTWPEHRSGHRAYNGRSWRPRRTADRAPARRRDRRVRCARSTARTPASSTASRSTRSTSAARPRRSSRRSSCAPGATPRPTTPTAPACARGSTRSPATRSSTRAGAPRCGPALALHEPGAEAEPRGRRSSRRCSAGRSPRRSSGSRPSTAR